MAVFKNICIIDDDYLFILLTKEIMQDEDFAEKIQTFEDGREALSYFKSIDLKNLPEVLFLDINMPMLDGWEVLDAIKEMEIETKMKVYITSSSINPADLKKSQDDVAICGFLSKPIDPRKLKDIAEDHNRL